jgi:hypothetical protein
MCARVCVCVCVCVCVGVDYTELVQEIPQQNTVKCRSLHDLLSRYQDGLRSMKLVDE